MYKNKKHWGEGRVVEWPSSKVRQRRICCDSVQMAEPLISSACKWLYLNFKCVNCVPVRRELNRNTNLPAPRLRPEPGRLSLITAKKEKGRAKWNCSSISGTKFSNGTMAKWQQWPTLTPPWPRLLIGHFRKGRWRRSWNNHFRFPAHVQVFYLFQIFVIVMRFKKVALIREHTENIQKQKKW